MIQSLSLKKPKILVVGDLMIDYYLWGKCERISPEAPVQVVDIKEENAVLGGAGNVVNNLLSLGAIVSVASVIGDDESGRELLAMLKKLNIQSDLIIKESGRKSSKKSRVMASHQQVVRFDRESKEDISKNSEEKILKLLKKEISSFDAILLSDYKKGVLTFNLTKTIIDLAKKSKVPILVDPKGSDYSKYRGATLLTPNKKEAIEATGIEINSKDSLIKALKKLQEENDLVSSMITLSEDGIAFLENGEFFQAHAQAKEVYDVTGAGDTVLATLGYTLSCKESLEKAALIANMAAAVVVGKLGSATATFAEIERQLQLLHQNKIDEKIILRENITQKLEPLKKEGKKVVFTNGCFDLLHRGHVSYLQASKAKGDILVVGLNSDKSVKRLKGKNRPIVTEADRAYILAALYMVDFVVIFEEDTPYELIKIVLPDVLTKGADYKDKEVVGSDIAKSVELIEFVDGKSTTLMISKMNI